mgnify:FL=1
MIFVLQERLHQGHFFVDCKSRLQDRSLEEEVMNNTMLFIVLLPGTSSDEYISFTLSFFEISNIANLTEIFQ